MSKTTAKVMFGDGQEATLTTDHSASSYGVPVLVYEGRAYGPDDVLRVTIIEGSDRDVVSMTAREIVHTGIVLTPEPIAQSGVTDGQTPEFFGPPLSAGQPYSTDEDIEKHRAAESAARALAKRFVGEA